MTLRSRAAWLLMLLAAATTGPAGRQGAAEPLEDTHEGTVVTLDALPLGIPLVALGSEARIRAETVLGGAIFAHRVSGLRARSREPVFRFLLDHPDFAASVARALRLGRYRVTATGDGYAGDDARGARGTIRLLHADDERRLYHLEGHYDAPGLPTIAGQILIELEYRHEVDRAGDGVLLASLTGHLRVDTPVAGALAHAVAVLARPAVERAVERKVRRFFGTVARVSRWAHDQPEELVAALEGHPEIADLETLRGFRDLLLADRWPAWADGSLRLLVPEPEEPEGAPGP